MKHHWRFFTYGIFVPLVSAFALVAGPIPAAHGWSPPVITVQANGCESGTASLYNPEGGTAHVTASNVFVVGSAIPGHGSISQQISGTGTLHITVTVDFPDHASASTDFTFTTCPHETTTTTTPTTTPSTEPPTTVHTMNPGPPPEETVHPKFTG